MVEKVAASLYVPIGRMLQQNKAEVWREVPQQVQVALNHSQPLPRLQGRERHNLGCFQLYSLSSSFLPPPIVDKHTIGYFQDHYIYMEEQITLYPCRGNGNIYRILLIARIPHITLLEEDTLKLVPHKLI